MRYIDYVMGLQKKTTTMRIKKFNQFINENHKVDNALKALGGENRDTTAAPSEVEQKSAAHPLYSDFVKLFDGHDNKLSLTSTLYVHPQVATGDLFGFKNTRIDYVTFNSNRDIAFWLKYDVENPNKDEVARLQAEFDEKYGNLTEEEYAAVEDEWEKDYDAIKALNPYIKDFMFCYIYDLPLNTLQSILNVLQQPVAKDTNKRIVELKDKKQFVLNKISTMKSSKERFELQKELWKLNDTYTDLTTGVVPTEKVLNDRQMKYNKTWEEQEKENEMMRKLMDE
jgi:hypothetical protein